jgi:hypothetical protein
LANAPPEPEFKVALEADGVLVGGELHRHGNCPGTMRNGVTAGAVVVSQDRSRDLVVLTKSGRDLLESRRPERELATRQGFHAGLRRPAPIPMTRR